MNTKYLHSIRTSLLSFTILMALVGGYTLQSVAQVVVLTNPTSPWTVPAYVTSLKVEVWGGGGGGGGASSGGTSGQRAGSGGGGGAYNVSTFTVVPAQTYTITKGTGGLGQVGNNAITGANSGTASTVTGTGGTVTANPGTAGVANNGAIGAGGTGGVYDGGNGGPGINGTTGNGGGGGGGAGNAGDGGNGTNTSSGLGGIGNPNNAPYIGGNGGAHKTTNGIGNAGSTPGGGGGGGRGGGGTTATGGAGAAGQIVFTYCVLPAQPSTITGSTTPCYGSSQTYSVTNVVGVTYNWTFPAGWTQTAGGTSNSVTVTVGSVSGNVQVIPSNVCGDGTARTLGVNPNVPASPTTTGASICTGNTTTLYASGAVSGDKYKWYDAATGGILLKTSTNYSDNTYTTPVLTITTNYWVAILTSGGCEGARTQVTATVSNPATSITGQTNISCFANNDGSITIQAGGGIPDYQFSVDNGLNYTTGSNPNPYTYTGLSANVPYKIRVIDSKGCESPAIP